MTDLVLASRIHGGKHQEATLNGEILAARVNLWKIGNGVNRLEAETEAANRGLVFCTLGDVAHTSDVGLVEWLAEMG